MLKEMLDFNDPETGWQVVKIYADGREKTLNTELTCKQAYYLAQQALVGCEKGEKVSLREPVVLDLSSEV